jgi:hypothetical protein
MHSVQPYRQLHATPHGYVISISSQKPGVSTTFPSTIKKNQENKEAPQIKSFSSKDYFPHSYPCDLSSKKRGSSLDEQYTKMNALLSCIEDPLWKHLCAEIINLMGPFAFQITQTQLGDYSSQDKTLDLFCHTEELAHFLRQYNFVIIGSLRRYFPYLKEVKVKKRTH